MSSAPLVHYHFAVIRLVPHVHLGSFSNIGVVLHARTAEFLAIRTLDDPALLQALAPSLDSDLLQRYLACFHGICEGRATAGPVALLPASERFHWLTALRSDVLQSSAVHEGLARDPAGTLDDLFRQSLAPTRPSRSDEPG